MYYVNMLQCTRSGSRSSTNSHSKLYILYIGFSNPNQVTPGVKRVKTLIFPQYHEAFLLMIGKKKGSHMTAKLTLVPLSIALLT